MLRISGAQTRHMDKRGEIILQNNQITLSNLTKAFAVKGQKDEIEVVVENISFSVEDRELITVMGPSGCGKSVLLKMIGGITGISGGSITIGEKNFTDRVPSEYKKKTGFVFQNDNLLPWRTVRKNLILPMETMGLKSDKADARVQEMLKLVGLEAYADIFPHELSGGMRQRVGVARALMSNPDVLLLDQPFGALDAITRKMMGYELLHLMHELGKTGILVTNDLDEALLLSSRIFIMGPAPGKIIKEIPVTLSYEERLNEIELNPTFGKLRIQLKDIMDHLE